MQDATSDHSETSHFPYQINQSRKIASVTLSN